MDKKKMIIIVVSIIAVILVAVIAFIVNKDKKIITYNVSFETDGGTIVNMQTINEGDKVTKPVDPLKEGYIFVEWTYQGVTYDFSLEVTSNLVLTAKWAKVEKDDETFIVKFDSDGGSTISNQIITKGSKVEKPSDPTKEGYTFKEWTLNDKTYDFDQIVEENLELKAKWEKIVTSNTTTNNNNNSNSSQTIVKKYTITFDSNGGSAVSSQTVAEGSKATQPSNPTRNGYTFAGWTLNGSTYNFSSPVTNNITLVANWNEVVKNNYTITFDSNGGSVVSSQTVAEGNKATQPSSPTRNGYTFAGWTLNGSTYNFNLPVTNNITLVAKWTQKTYTITATRVDAYSPDSILSVFEDGKKITVQSIKYSDGTYLCSGTNTTVNTNDITGETSFIIVLSDGTQVNATLQ
ncbi:MAG: InlB B-repeat-containing protein [bacterium]|nr:InlB B-repeat-containing protein [bacterium]